MQRSIADKLSLTILLVVLSITGPPAVSLGLIPILLVLRAFVPLLRPLNPSIARRFFKILGFVALAAIIMALVNAVFLKEGAVMYRVMGVDLYQGGVDFGVRTGSRLLLLVASLLMLFGSTAISDLASFLHGFGLPTSVVMTILLTLHFMETLPQRIQRIYAAQEARGAPVRSHMLARARSFVALLSPLLLSSIVESIDRGKALELRGFRTEGRLFAESFAPFRPSLLTIMLLTCSLAAIVLPWVLK